MDQSEAKFVAEIATECDGSVVACDKLTRSQEDFKDRNSRIESNHTTIDIGPVGVQVCRREIRRRLSELCASNPFFMDNTKQ